MPINSVRAAGLSMLLALGAPAAIAQPADDARLVAAVKNRDTKTFQALLPRVNVNAAQPDGATALHWAAHWNDVDAAGRLIRAGANVNTATDLGVTPLLLACSDAGAAMVTLLLKAGARPDVTLPSGETALMVAARTGQLESVQALLSRGADVNARESSRGQTALMWAAAQRHADVVRLLIDAGADVQARSAVRPRLGFVAGNRNGTGHSLQEQKRLSVEFQEGGFTALLFAAQQGDVESATHLLAAGADVNDTAPVGTSALVIAAHSNQSTVAARLLEKGADPNADGAGYTALHAAILRGNAPLVTMLLARGANPDARLTRPTPARRYGNEWAFGDNMVGATPFYLAAKFGELELMRILAAAHADPRLAAPDGSTPLMMALDTPTVRAGGVDGFGTDRRDRYGLISGQTPEQIESDALEIARLVMELGGDVNAADLNGNTALHLAAAKGLNRVIELLVAKGARLNVKNKREQTPLAAAEAGAAGAARRRIASGTQANAASSTSPTAALLRKLGAVD